MAENIVGRLAVVLGLDVKELQSDLEKAQAQFEAFFDGIGRLAAAIGVSLGVKDLIDSAVELTTAFDSAMREVWTLTNMNAEEFERLKQQVVELSKSGPFALDDLAKALYQTISAGVDASDAIEFLQVAMKAAQAGATDLFTAVDGLTTALNAWNLSVQQAQEVSDAFFVAIREGKTTFSELARFIGTVAPTAAQAGVSLEELLSAVAALTKQGLSTNRAMTSLTYVLQAIINPTEEAKKKAQELGIAFDTATLQAKGLAEFLKYVAEAAHGDQRTLAELFGSVEALRGVFALTGNAVEDFNNTLKMMKERFGETEKASQKMVDSLENQLRTLHNRWNALLLALGEQLKPLVQALIVLAEKTIAWIESMSPAEKAILGVLGALTLLVPAVKTATVFIAALQGAFGNLSSVAMAAAAALGMWATLRILSTEVEATTQSVRRFSDSLEEVSKKKTDVFEEVASGVKTLENNIESAQRDAEDFMNAVVQLAQAVSDYNYAVETGLGDQERLKKIIEELVKQYPQLADVIELVGNKYEIQQNKLKDLIELEIRRLEFQKQAAEAELKALTAVVNSPDWQKQKQIVEDAYANAEQSVAVLEKAVEKWKQKAAQGVAGAQAMYETLNKALVEMRSELSKYAQKLVEIRELEAKVVERRITTKTLDATIKKLRDMIEHPPSPQPQYERKLSQLDKLISQYQAKLQEAKDKESEAFKTDLEMLKYYIEEKRSLLSKALRSTIETSPQDTEKIRRYVEQIRKLDETLEQLRQMKQKETTSGGGEGGGEDQLERMISEIEKSFDVIQKALEDGQKDLAERVYRGTLQEISAALIKAYEESNKSAAERLLNLQDQLKIRYSKIFEKEPPEPQFDFEKLFKELEENTKIIQKAIEDKNASVAKRVYSTTVAKITEGIVEAYRQGNAEAKKKLEQMLADLNKIVEKFTKESESKGGKKPPEKKDIFNIDEILANFSAIEKALQNKQDELAKGIYQKTLSELKSALEKAYAQLNDEALKELEQLLEELRKKYGSIFEKDKDKYEEAYEEIQKNTAAITAALTAEQEEIAKSLYSHTKSLIVRYLEEAYVEGNQEAIKRLTKELQNLEEHFGPLFNKQPEENIIKLDHAKARQVLLEHAEELRKAELNIRKNILISQLQRAEFLKEQLELLEQLRNLYEELGDAGAVRKVEAQISSIKQKLQAAAELKKEQAQEERLKRLYEFFRDIGENESAKRFLGSLIDFYETQLEKAALAEETIFGRGAAAIERLRAQLEMYRREYKELEEEETRQKVEALEAELASAETLEEKQEILEQIVELYKELGEEGLVKRYQQQLNEMTNKLREQRKELELQKRQLEKEADLWNSFISELASQFEQLGDIGEAIAEAIRAIRFEVVQTADGTYEIVSNLQDINQLSVAIGGNLAQWAIGEIANQITSLWNMWQRTQKLIDKNKWESREMTETAELFKNFREFEENQKQLEQARLAKAGAVIGAGATGAIIGAILGGPLGALIGAGIGAAIGDAMSKSLDEKIEELSEKLQATFEKIKEALGTTIEDVADAMADAFSADTYKDFVDNFTVNLYKMTRQALIKAFLASDYMQKWYKQISDYISKAVLDKRITPEEKATIKQMAEDAAKAAKEFYEMLNEMFPETGAEWSQSAVVKETITEETGNRLAALFATMNLHVADIKDMLKSVFTGDALRVLVTNTEANPVEVRIAQGAV